MKGRFEGLRRFGSKAGRLLVSGALACSLTPALALAETGAGLEATGTNLTAQHYEYDNNSGKVTFDKDGNPQGKAVTLLSADAANHVYTYRGYAHSDEGKHYKGYSLITKLTTNANGVLTGIDLTSDNSTFAGMWGYARGKGAAPIDGYLPDGVTFNMATNSDGTFTPDLTDPKYGMTLISVTLISTNADGTKDATDTYSNESYDVEKKTVSSTHIETSYTGDKTNIKLPAFSARTKKLVRDENGNVKTEEQETTGRNGKTKTTVAVTEEVEVTDSAYNLIKLTYQTKNEIMPFDCYYCIEGQYKEEAERYVDNCVGDEDGKTVYTNNVNTTNREGWTGIMGTVMLRQLASWGATLSNPSAANGLAGELGSVDVVSGATKTSDPFVSALTAARQAGYIKGVAENVKFTLDGSSKLKDVPPVDINENPQDKSSVAKNDSNQYVLTTRFHRYGGGRLTLNSVYLLNMKDMPLGTQGMLTTAQYLKVYDKVDRAAEAARAATDGNTDYQEIEKCIVATYGKTSSAKDGAVPEGETNKALVAQGSTETITNDSPALSYEFSHSSTAPESLTSGGHGVLTVKNPDVTHVVMNYTLGHGEVAIVYDLEEMSKVPNVSATLHGLTTTSSAEEVSNARATYNKLKYDVRPFVGGLDNLIAQEARVSIAAKATDLSSSDSAKSAEAAQQIVDAYEALTDAEKQNVGSDAVSAVLNAHKTLVDKANSEALVSKGEAAAAKSEAALSKSQADAAKREAAAAKNEASAAKNEASAAKSEAAAAKSEAAAAKSEADAAKSAAANAIKANTMTVSANTITAKAKKKTSFAASKAFTVKDAQGAVKYYKASGNAKVKVSANGKVTVAKGLKKKKTVKAKVLVVAEGNASYAPVTKTVTLKVKVK